MKNTSWKSWNYAEQKALDKLNNLQLNYERWIEEKD
jgi:hypothetical protein